MADRPIDELKIEISVDESSKVEKSLDSIIAKLEKINGVGKGKEAFSDLSTTLSNMDKALSKVSTSITKIENGISKIATITERWGGNFSNAAEKVGRAFQNVSDNIDKSAKGIATVTEEIKQTEKALGNVKIEDHFDSTSVKQVTESIEEANGSLSRVTENADQIKDVFDNFKTVEAPFKQYDTQSIVAQMEDYASAINKTVTEAERLNAIDMSKQYSQVDLLKEKYNELADKLAIMLKGDDFGGKKFADTISQMQKIDAQIQKITESERAAWNGVENLNNSFRETRRVSDKIAAPIVRMSTAILDSAKGFNKAHVSLEGFVKTLFKISTFPFSGIAQQIGSIGSRLKGMIKSFMRVAKMRAFRYTIRMIVAGIREGIDNAYQWAKAMGHGFSGAMDQIATATQYLKNSLGALATPIINALAPAFDYIIDKVVTLLNLINRLIARLTGASTWVKAVKHAKEYSDAVSGAAGSAGKLADELVTILGIDEINPLNAAKDSGGGGGGGGGIADDYSSMFEEVAMESDRIFGDIFEPFEKAWKTKGQGVIDSINNALNGVKLLAESVGKSFYDVWTNGTGQKSIEHILGIFTGISNTIGNIASQLAAGWSFNDNGTRLVQNLWNILNDILKMWDDITNITADWAAQLDFRPLIKGLADFAGGLEKVIEPLTRGITWAWENIILVLGEWVIEKGLPRVLESLGTALGSVGEALSAIGNSKAGDIIGGIIGFLTDNALTTLDIAVQRFSDLMKLISDIADIISGKKSLKMVWFERIEELLLRLQTRLYYVSKAWEALNNFDFKGVEENSRNAWNPTNSPYYLNMKALINKVEDKRSAKDKRLEFVANITDGSGFSSTMPSGGKLGSGGVTYGRGGGAANLGQIDFGTTDMQINAVANITDTIDNLPTDKKIVQNMTANLQKKVEDFTKTTDVMTATLGKKTESFVKTTDPMSATLTKKAETFNKTTDPMTAKLLTKSELFNKTTSGMTAKLASKNELFNKTTGGMIAKLSSKNELFNKTTGGMTAKLSNKSELFNKITSAMTAYLAYKQDNIRDRSIWGLTGYLSYLYKSANMNGISLTGTLSSDNGRVAMYVYKDGGILDRGFSKSIPQYASGTLNAGSMFVAGEAGPEIVGNIRGRTEVLNQSQIAQAMASSMVQANASQNALLQEQNSLLRQLLNKDTNVTAILSTSSLIDGANRQNKRAGRTVIPVGV